MRKPLTDKDGEVRELTLADMKRFKPASEVLSKDLLAVLPKRKRGERGAQKSPTKESVTIRFSREVLDYFRESGVGWQTKINNALKDWVEHHKKAA
jgi:uncharacterized protein (DUF4415 family)